MPRKYANDRCYRTMKTPHPEVPIERTGTHHKALDQSFHLVRMMP